MEIPAGSGKATERMLYGDAFIAVGEVGPICIAVWRGAVTKEPFERQRAALEEVVARHPDGAGFLCIVAATAKPPDDELRRASAQMVQAHINVLKCVACVMEGEGFRAAINRGAFAGMVLLLRDKKLPISVFATVEPALDWMAVRLDLRSVRSVIPSIQRVRSYFSEPSDAPHPGNKRSFVR